MFLVFIAQYPYIRFFFGIPAWVLGAVFLGIEVLQILTYDSSDELVFLFVTLAVAALTARAFGLADSPLVRPQGPAARQPTEASAVELRRRPARPRPASLVASVRPLLQRASGDVVEGPWSSGRPGRLPTPPGTDPGDQAELDHLLDKINAGGIDGLTSSEKRRLNELSKRLRDRGSRSVWAVSVSSHYLGGQSCKGSTPRPPRPWPS